MSAPPQPWVFFFSVVPVERCASALLTSVLSEALIRVASTGTSRISTEPSDRLFRSAKSGAVTTVSPELCAIAVRRFSPLNRSASWRRRKVPGAASGKALSAQSSNRVPVVTFSGASRCGRAPGANAKEVGSRSGSAGSVTLSGTRQATPSRTL